MDLRFETACCLSSPHIRHGFFTRHGGVSSGVLSSLNCAMRPEESKELVKENRRRVLGALGITDFTLVIPHLAHGNNSIIVDESTEFSVGDKADAVITASAGLALGITYADCLPILVAATDHEVVAAIHAGWRGIQCGVIAATIERIRKNFGNKELVAAVGPAISQDGFTVTDDVFNYFHTYWPSFVIGREDVGYVDLTGIARRQLADTGVMMVEKVGGYTDSDMHNYFSHRRDRGESGRHLAIIAKAAR